MKVSLIVAMDKNRGIGKNNDLMWHLPNDMRFFKETTAHQIVVMGRRTMIQYQRNIDLYQIERILFLLGIPILRPTTVMCFML